VSVCYLTAGKFILKCSTVFSVLSTIFFKPHDSVFYSFRYIVTKINSWFSSCQNLCKRSHVLYVKKKQLYFIILYDKSFAK
jgi:hypothetical protein